MSLLKNGKGSNGRNPYKTISKTFLILFVFIACINVAFAKGENPKKDDSVLRATLENGLRVIIVKNDLAPVVTTELNYLVGADEVPKGFPGTAHALEHMMFRGSKGLNADQLADISAAMGGNFNADTRQNVTQYFFLVPSEDLDLALHVESIRMKSLLSTDSLWKNERGAIEQEVAQDLSNPQYVFYKKLLEAMFKGTPYAHDALGTKSSFDKTTGAMLKKFHESWYVPNNAVLVIVGKVDPQNALKDVKNLFGDIPNKKLPQRPEINLNPVKTDTLNLNTDLPYGLAVVSFRMPGTSDPDYAAAQILTDVLNNRRGDLYGLVPQGKALYAGFSLSGLPKSGLSFTVGVFPKGANSKKLLKEESDVLSKYLKKGFPKDLVLAAKNHEIANAEFRKNSILGLANAWSEAVAVDGNESPNAELDMLKKVTVEDVDRVARKYLNFNHAIYAILTPQESGKPISRKGFGGAESFAPKNPKAVELPEWAQNSIEQLKVPESVIHPVVDTLSNGIRLIIQPESISNSVSIYGEVKNNPDLEIPKGREGVSSVLSQLFSYGTTSLDRLAFQKALDDIGAHENAGANFRLEVPGKNIEKGVQLLADNLLHPALPEKYFKVVQTQTAREVAGELKSPDYLSHRAMWESLLPKNDPQLRHSTPGSIDSLSIKNVKEYYSKVFRPDLTTIVVAGNIDPKEAKQLIEKYFTGWKAQGLKPKTEYSPVPLNKPETTAVPDKSRIQDAVTLAENLELTRSNPEYYALQLGNRVLGGGFYASRFYKDLRENSGLVYYVSSRFNVGKTRATYMVSYGCDPPNVSKARSVIVRDLKEMQKTPVGEKELHQAKEIAVRTIQVSESSVGSIANGLLSRSINDLPLNEPTITAKKYLEMTSQEIRDAFSKWVHPDNFVQVSQGPNPQ